ncbi:MAG: PEP-CTERM sorting domain-containing protein, partial [Halobacteriales archaeon]|nr:PEP-CTERM sorting domain-containing protein [Halobacteriales archaeon]
AGGSFFWSWTNVCGGNNFITCSSGSFFYDSGTRTITVTIVNEAVETDVYRGVGLFNLPVSPFDWDGSPAPADGWEEGPLPDAGIPGDRFTVRGDGAPESLPEGPTFTFNFEFDTDIMADIGDVGVIYHAISGPNNCSTTVGVVHDGEGGGEAFPNSSDLDPTCTTEMPEPTSMVLLGTGLAAMLGIARRRERLIETED